MEKNSTIDCLTFLQDENIDLGFKSIRDEFYFTTHRILFVDKQGITGKETEYKSCPYHSIKAFSIETSGGFDSDSEMKVYAGSLDLSIDFDKKKVDIFEIQKYLSGHVFADSMEELLAYNAANLQETFTGKEGGSATKLMNYLAGDFSFFFKGVFVMANVESRLELSPAPNFQLSTLASNLGANVESSKKLIIRVEFLLVS